MQEDGCEKITRVRFSFFTTWKAYKTLSKFFCQNYFSQRKCVTRHHLILGFLQADMLYTVDSLIMDTSKKMDGHS